MFARWHQLQQCKLKISFDVWQVQLSVIGSTIWNENHQAPIYRKHKTTDGHKYQTAGFCFSLFCAHTDTPVTDFFQRMGSNSVRSALRETFHTRPLQTAEEPSLCYFHLSGLLPAQWPAPIPAARHLCGATTYTLTHIHTRTCLHSLHRKKQAISQQLPGWRQTKLTDPSLAHQLVENMCLVKGCTSLPGMFMGGFNIRI